MAAHRIDPGPHALDRVYAHLRDGGPTDPLPAGATFWDDVMAGKYPQLEQGRLMGKYGFDRDWPSWERHPHGDELILLLSGSFDFVLEERQGERLVPLRHPGDYVVVPAGTWHTARAREPSVMLFVTPGRGTEHRPVGA